MTNSTTLTERQQYWLKHIRACDAAGQTTINYAKAHGINVKSMYSATLPTLLLCGCDSN